jgi:ribosome biogenesis GTPase
MKSNTEVVRGLVIRGSHNILTVRLETGTELECRIKGKVLKDAGDLHNPIACGDAVFVEGVKEAGTGMILSVEKRRNLFSRFNQKGKSSQLLAANVDLLLCVTTPASPPFRPRFLDRVLAQADAARIEAVIVCNKIDLEPVDIDVEERLEDFCRIAYQVFRVSAKTGEGMTELALRIEGKTSVLAGQSGVGKSSLINALCPSFNIKEGRLNEKTDRGVHTTTMSFMVDLPGETRLIDTPGVRRFIPDGISGKELISHLREFAPLEGKCAYGLSCSHRTEPGCKIMEAVAAGVIHEDRYDSFLRIRDDLETQYNDD